MAIQRTHLQIAIVWIDVDLHEVVVDVQSGCFSGSTSLYTLPGEIVKLGKMLTGFPSSFGDQRVFELGQSIPSSDSRVKFTFKCRDAIGNLCVQVEIQKVAEGWREASESCTVVLLIVPSDMDRFVDELLRMQEVGHLAILKNSA